MIQQAIASDDPVIFYEPKQRYWDKAEVDLGAAVQVAPGLANARVVLEGEDITLVAYGPTTRTALDVAQIAATEGHSVEVIDLRSLSPLDMPTLIGSATKTGRVIVVHEAPTFVGLGAEIAAAISERCFHQLSAPVLRVGGYNTPYPPARAEEDYLPDIDHVLDAIDVSLAY
jgi:2-oxoisovalerate dehydrogenase E1 component beta subunit